MLWCISKWLFTSSCQKPRGAGGRGWGSRLPPLIFTVRIWVELPEVELTKAWGAPPKTAAGCTEAPITCQLKSPFPALVPRSPFTAYLHICVPPVGGAAVVLWPLFSDNKWMCPLCSASNKLLGPMVPTKHLTCWTGNWKSSDTYF